MSVIRGMLLLTGCGCHYAILPPHELPVQASHPHVSSFSLLKLVLCYPMVTLVGHWKYEAT